MSWIAKLLGVPEPVTPTPAPRILPTDMRLLCDCGDDRPMEPFLMLCSYALRDTPDGRVLISVPDGATLRCHSCNAVMDVGPRGKFRPAMFNRVEPPRQEAADGPDREAMLNPPPAMRTPVARPRT